MATRKKTTAAPAENKTGVVFGGALNIRQEPTTASAIVNTMKDGTMITILEDLGDWLRIDGGYVMSKWVK